MIKKILAWAAKDIFKTVVIVFVLWVIVAKILDKVAPLGKRFDTNQKFDSIGNPLNALGQIDYSLDRN